jgi:hypothetical protein
MDDGLKQQGVCIQFHADLNFDLAQVFEMIGEMLTERNAAYFREYDVDASFLEPDVVAYENPRMAGPGQVIGDAETIAKRLRATCFDWAAAVAGYARAQGRRARVVVVPLISKDYGRIGAEHHALVESDSGVVDVCTLLRGYGKSPMPILPVGTVGACCAACAYDGTLFHHDSCAACDEGSCNIHHHHHHGGGY